MAATRSNPDERALSVRDIALWLLEYLESDSPRLVRDVQQEAERRGIALGRLRDAATKLPLIRRATKIRGPWGWSLPKPEELVQVQYHCPIVDCNKTAEGWMEFELSRLLFTAGLVDYLTKGRLRRTLPSSAQSTFLRLSATAEE